MRKLSIISLILPIFFFVASLTGPASKTGGELFFNVYLENDRDGTGRINYCLNDVKDFNRYVRFRFRSASPREASLRYVYVLIKSEAYPWGIIKNPAVYSKAEVGGDFARFVSSQRSYHERGRDPFFLNRITYKACDGAYLHVEVEMPSKSSVLAGKIKTGQPPVQYSNLPEFVRTPDQAKLVLRFAENLLREKLNLVVFYPVEITLASRRDLEKKKNQLGANLSGYCKTPSFSLDMPHRFYHHVYYLKDQPRNEFLAGICHELTHAWQYENCPPQDDYLAEGLAQWVEWKVLNWLGDRRGAAKLLSTKDPHYIKGFRFVRELELEYSSARVPGRIRGMREIPEKYKTPQK